MYLKIKGCCLPQRDRRKNLFLTSKLVDANATEGKDFGTDCHGAYEPKPLEIVEHFNFNRKQQGPEETVAQYVAELRRLPTYCNYGAFLNAALVIISFAVS